MASSPKSPLSTVRAELVETPSFSAAQRKNGPSTSSGQTGAGFSPLQQRHFGFAVRFGDVVANSVRVRSPDVSPSAPAKRSLVATAHSSKLSRLLPSLSSLRNAAVRVDIISTRLIRSLRRSEEHTSDLQSLMRNSSTV